MKNETIILFTSNYPFGKGESFIENEIKILALSFKKCIIISNNLNDKKTRSVPENVVVERFSSKLNQLEKISSFKYLFNRIIIKEILFTKKVLKLKWTFFKMKTSLISFFKAKKINKNIFDLQSKYFLHKTNCIYYSYWMDDNAIALSFLASEKKICRVHGWDLYFERNKESYLPFRKQILENLKVFSISQLGKTYLKDKTNFEKVQISRLGTKALKRNILKTINKKRIVSCSNVIPLKRISLIIESLELLTHLNIEWIHFGDGPLLNELKLLAKEKSLNAVFKGNVSNTAILNFLQNEPIDLFINLSSTEGIPVSIMEAFSCGIPAIATNVGGTSELVNNANGILLSSNPSAKSIAKEIEQFLKLNEKEIESKRSIAFETWNNKFNAEKNYTEFAEIISNL